MKDIMFVCTGNTCRSPMAEALAKKLIGDDRIIISRGISVFYDEGANPKSVDVMEGFGVDIRDHRSKQFAIDDITPSMIILTMTLKHKLFLAGQYPSIKGRIFTVLEYVGEDGDILDPYGYDALVYKRCGDRLHELIAQMVQKELL